MAKEQAKLECEQLLFRYRFQHIQQHQNQPHFDSPLHSPTENLTSHSGGFNSYLSSMYRSPSIPANGSYESQTVRASSRSAVPAQVYGSPSFPETQISTSAHFINSTDIVQKDNYIYVQFFDAFYISFSQFFVIYKKVLTTYFIMSFIDYAP